MGRGGRLCNNLADPPQIGFPRHFRGVKQSVRTGPQAKGLWGWGGSGPFGGACVCLCARGAACWKFNLECHSFEGGPAACQRHHDNLHRPQSPYGGGGIEWALLIFYKGVNKVTGIFRCVQDLILHLFFHPSAYSLRVLCSDVSVAPVCVCLVRYLVNSSNPPPTHTPQDAVKRASLFFLQGEEPHVTAPGCAALLA